MIPWWRALRDVTTKWLTLAVIALLAAAVTAQGAFLADEGARALRAGWLEDQHPYEPISFLQMLDPDLSVIEDVDEDSYSAAGLLMEPGIAALTEIMEDDPRLSFIDRLESFTADYTMFPIKESFDIENDVLSYFDVPVVVGSAPDMLPEAARGISGSSIMGPMPEMQLQNMASDRLGPVDLTVVSDHLPVTHYVDETGSVATVKETALIHLTVEDARTLGMSGEVLDVVNALSCRCTAEELAVVADAMNAAEAEAGTSRHYFAATYDQIAPRTTAARGAQQAMDMVSMICVVLAVGLFLATSLALLWRRLRHGYAVERVLGAPEWWLQARQQLIVLLAITIPIAVAFYLPNYLVRHGDGQWLWKSAELRAAMPWFLVGLHCAIGAAAAWRVRRLCANPTQWATATD